MGANVGRGGRLGEDFGEGLGDILGEANDYLVDEPDQSGYARYMEMLRYSDPFEWARRNEQINTGKPETEAQRLLREKWERENDDGIDELPTRQGSWRESVKQSDWWRGLEQEAAKHAGDPTWWEKTGRNVPQAFLDLPIVGYWLRAGRTLGDIINLVGKKIGGGGSGMPDLGEDPNANEGAGDWTPPWWEEGGGFVPAEFHDRDDMDPGRYDPRYPDTMEDPFDPDGGGGGGGGGDDGGGGFLGGPGGADPNFQFPTGPYDYGWDRSLAKYGGIANLAGGGGMGGDYGGGGYEEQDPYGYYGQPGGGAPMNFEGGGGYEGTPGQGYTMDARLRELLQNDPAANYESTPFEGSEYGDTPGGPQRDIPFGFGGEMKQYNTTPYYDAMSRGIDENAQKAVDQQAEDFGAQGMRWSTPLMAAQGETRRGAADDKSRLLSKLNYDEFQNAYERARGEQKDIYGRSRELEQEAQDRWRRGDETDFSRWRYGDEAGWDRAQQKGNRAFERTLSLDDRMSQRLRDQEQEEYQRWQGGDQTAYGRWMDANQRRTQLEQQGYGRWLTGDENAFNREQAAANFNMALGGQQNQYNDELYGDLFGMGGADERLAQGDLDAYREMWERSQGGYDDQLLPLLSSLMGNTPQSQGKEGFDWSKLVGALGNVDWGKIFGSDSTGGDVSGTTGGG